MNTKYCITCEREVHVYELTVETYFHLKTVKLDIYNEPKEVAICEGPFAVSAPVELSDQDWESIFNDEPGVDELALMDANAVEMLS